MRKVHQLTCEGRASNGVEDWSCPICGYRAFILWSPYHKQVLNPGNAAISHSATRTNVSPPKLKVDRGPTVDEMGTMSEFLKGLKF